MIVGSYRICNTFEVFIYIAAVITNESISVQSHQLIGIFQCNLSVEKQTKSKYMIESREHF